MSQTVDVPLNKTLTKGDEKITSIQLRKPGAGELRGTALLSILQMDVDTMLTLLPRISTPPLTVEELCPDDFLEDFTALSMEAMGFFAGSKVPSRTT